MYCGRDAAQRKMLVFTEKIRRVTLVSVCMPVLLANIAGAYAGPPLVTDDTGIVPLGEWQFIVSAQGESRPATESGALPAFEATYGFFEDMNLTAVVQRQYIKDRGAPSKTGLGEAPLNFKWLFYDSDVDSIQGVTLAISPIYSFPLTSSSRIRGLAEDVRVLSMPVLASLVRGRWEFIGSFSYDYASGSSSVDGVAYGLITAYNATDNLQLMGEIYGSELSGDGFVDAGLNYDEGFLNWRLGLLWQVGSGYSFLAAFGAPIDSDLPTEDTLDCDFFLGLQYDTG